jgi:DNA-binding transcriptional MerR regulator
MALTLTPGREMRLDGAPALPLPNEMEMIESLAADLLANDTDGIFNGNRAMAREYATQQYRDMVRMRQDQTAGAEARAGKRNADRNAQRAAARGVDPESLPADEYGGVSRQTVREANRPPDDAEAALMQDQDLADEIVGGLRTGDQNWQAEADRQYSQEYGLGGFEYGPGQTDLDIRRRIQGQQGFIRTQQGMVPMGRDPTPEQIENYRNFHEKWANETPGSERQARYNPEAYEEFREGVRNDIRDRAKDDEATYGTGPESQLLDSIENGNDMAARQYENRKQRAASEDRVAEAEREVRIARLARQAGVTRAEARAMMDKERAGMQPAGAAPLPLNVAQRRQETQGLRDRAGTRRDAELAARQEALRSQRMLLAPGGRGMVNAINELPDDWRHIAILDRITQGRVGGPTPLGVDAANMELAAPVIRSALAGAVQGMDPAAAADRKLAQQLQMAQLPPEQKVALSIEMKQPMGTGYSAGHVGSRWNYWMKQPGVRGAGSREQNFRMEMEGLGYLPAEIDAWIDSRIDAEPPAGPAPEGGGGAIPSPPPPPARRGPR